MSRPRKSQPAQQQSLKVLTTDEQSSFTGLNLSCKKARICGSFLQMRVCCLSRFFLHINNSCRTCINAGGFSRINVNNNLIFSIRGKQSF